MKWIALLCILFISSQNQDNYDNEFKVFVKLTNLKSDEGKLSVSIYNDPKTFPKTTGMLEEKIVEDFRDGECTLSFTGLKPGTYAVAGLHDENGDGKMNFNLIGIPKEGYCFSNNVMPKLRAAKWDESKFILKDSNIHIEIEMKY